MNEEKNRKDRREKPNAIRIENAFPAIISAEDFNRVQEILRSRKRSAIQKHRCSGLVYCGECGAKMHLARTKRKGHEYSSFHCSACCGASIVHTDVIDEAVDRYISELLNEKKI